MRWAERNCDLTILQNTTHRGIVKRKYAESVSRSFDSSAHRTATYGIAKWENRRQNATLSYCVLAWYYQRSSHIPFHCPNCAGHWPKPCWWRMVLNLLKKVQNSYYGPQKSKSTTNCRILNVITCQEIDWVFVGGNKYADSLVGSSRSISWYTKWMSVDSHSNQSVDFGQHFTFNHSVWPHHTL